MQEQSDLRPKPLGRAPLLRADAELGARLDPERRRAAEAAISAPAFELQPGPWVLPEGITAPGVLGVLVVEGLAGAHVGSGERSFLELVGREDVLQPWVTLGGEASTPTEVRWQTFAPTRVLVLGPEAAAAISAFPELVAALMERLVLRTRRMAFQLAVHRMVRIDERLDLILWHLADRWGRVNADGVVLELPLTHQQLAAVIGAQRPSLTSAVGALEAQGRLSRGPGARWVLHGEAPSLYGRLRLEAALTA